MVRSWISIAQEKKNSFAGQMSLFDLVSDEDKKDFEIRMPNVGEYDKEMVLAFEKEVLGIYLSAGIRWKDIVGSWTR